MRTHLGATTQPTAASLGFLDNIHSVWSRLSVDLPRGPRSLSSCRRALSLFPRSPTAGSVSNPSTKI